MPAGRVDDCAKVLNTDGYRSFGSAALDVGVRVASSPVVAVVSQFPTGLPRVGTKSVLAVPRSGDYKRSDSKSPAAAEDRRAQCTDSFPDSCL